MMDLEDGTDYNDTNKLFMAGDTLIGGYHYQILQQSGFLQTVDLHFGNSYLSSYFDNYKGAIRQDTLLKRVYIVPSDSLTEMLLYDFNLSVGDTLPISYNNTFSSNYVSRIDSILVGE